VQLFEEVKRHKPSVIYLPDVDIWWETLGDSAIRTFVGLLQSLPPTDPVLVLGVMNKEPNKKHTIMMKELFGYSQKNQYPLVRPDESARMEYFQQLIDIIKKEPTHFPEMGDRKRRKLADLPVAQIEEPRKLPSKAEIKAQVKKDRQTLNMLKLRIQPIMDQIKRLYRKFRSPIVEEAVIRYLYDEQDPNIVSTDLTVEQRQQQQLFRPYEVDKDEKGVGGLREVATNKFYYNLDIVMIEQRLSNGYYKRPKDFLADIKRLAKDSKTFGDPDRVLKANEMLANVEVDIGSLEQSEPALTAECEGVYQREQERARERLMKVREAQRDGEDVPKVMPNIPPPDDSKTTTETTGPIVLGQEVPGRSTLFPVTPNKLFAGETHSNPWSIINGSHPSHHTNGSTVPSRPQEDSEMLDNNADELDEHHQQQAASWQSPSQQNTQCQRSQKSVHTQLAQGSQFDQYQNSASTTTSGQKTSDKSRSSGPFSVQSNGVRGHHPDLPMMEPTAGNSQLPDTQPVQLSSQSQQSQSSQHMPPPAPPHAAHRHSVTDINSLLNQDADNSADRAAKISAAQPRFIIDQGSLNALREALTKKTSGMSVEQLEQINASLMAVIWDKRGEWNRNHVVKAVEDAFNETVRDIELCQTIMKPSQDDD
jgi:ATPase family AAA domain-containing protein 2